MESKIIYDLNINTDYPLTVKRQEHPGQDKELESTTHNVKKVSISIQNYVSQKLLISYPKHTRSRHINKFIIYNI